MHQVMAQPGALNVLSVFLDKIVSRMVLGVASRQLVLAAISVVEVWQQPGSTK
jgi:hypothetical protein